MNQVTYVSLSKWTQYINIRWIFAMFDQYLLFYELVARHLNKVFFCKSKSIDDATHFQSFQISTESVLYNKMLN